MEDVAANVENGVANGAHGARHIVLGEQPVVDDGGMADVHLRPRFALPAVIAVAWTWSRRCSIDRGSRKIHTTP